MSPGTKPLPENEMTLLDRLLRESYDRAAWHGPNLRAVLRGVDARIAAWRPPRGHNIWELARHAAYWHHAVFRRLTGDRSAFEHGRDWTPAPEAGRVTDGAWHADLRLLSRHHARVRAALAALDPRELHRPARAHRQSPALLLRGLACHNLYHAGQIQLLRRLAGG